MTNGEEKGKTVVGRKGRSMARRMKYVCVMDFVHRILNLYCDHLTKCKSKIMRLKKINQTYSNFKRKAFPSIREKIATQTIKFAMIIKVF